MDPLSITLSITALLKLTKDVVIYVKEVKDHVDERRSFVRETSSLSGMLNTLVHFVNEDPDKSWLHATSDLLSRGGPFDQYSSALQSLKAKIVPGSSARMLTQVLLWRNIKQDVQGVLSQIERLKTIVGIALDLDHMKLSREIKSYLSDMSMHVSKLQISNTAIQDHTAVICDDTLARQKQALLDRICSTDYLQHHRDAIIRHQDGTGKWFLEDTKYQHWLSTSSSTLVCPGVPGAGKTIMAALIIEQCLRVEQPARDEPVVFIYYKYKLQDQQTLRHTLEAILRQVVNYVPGIPDSLERLFSHNPSLEEIKAALQQLLKHCKMLTIVTDALDECHDRARNDILSCIANLQAIVPTRYLATTRDYYIDKSHAVFRGQPMLEVKASKHDLELYTRHRTGSLRTRLQPDLLEHLISGVVEAADGMFLLAQLLMDSFQTKLKVKLIKCDLQNLPKGLDAYDSAYRNAMARITSQEEHHRESAEQILSLILCAKRPLRIDELQHALMVEPADTELDLDNILEVENILSVCEGLIVIDKESKVVRFVHYTTQEYLQRTREQWLPRAEFEIARACLDYCLLPRLGLRISNLVGRGDQSRTHLIFAEYAVKQGPSHWNAVVKTEECLHGRLESLLRGLGTYYAASRSSNKYVRDHQRHLMILEEAGIWENPERPQAHEYSIVHFLSEQGLANLLEFCIHNHFDFEKTAQSQTPLSIAAECGEESTVLLLLQHGAAIDSKDNSGRSPLFHAVQRKHLSTVEILIKQNASIDFQDYSGRTPLHCAAECGFSQGTEMLLSAGADPNIVDRDGQSPLHTAVQRSKLVDVTLLCDTTGVDVDRRDKKGRTPLWYASQMAAEWHASRMATKRQTDCTNYADHDSHTAFDRIVHTLLNTNKVDAAALDPAWSKYALGCSECLAESKKAPAAANAL